MRVKPSPDQQEEVAATIFEDWKEAVIDKNSKNMPSDFASLFDLFKGKGIGRKVVRKYVPKAISYYAPSMSTKKWVYDRLKAEGKAHSTKEEFFDSWDELISKECRRAYFAAYPLKKHMTVEQANDHHPFSTKEEYDKYRQYADGFRTLTKEDLDRIDAKRQTDFKDFVDRVIKMSKERGIVITEDELLGKKH